MKNGARTRLDHFAPALPYSIMVVRMGKIEQLTTN